MSDILLPKISETPTRNVIITPYMPKGGVGKTTTAAHLGFSLTKYGKTLLIDTDPQGNLTNHLINETAFLEQNKTLLGYFNRTTSFADSLIEARKPDTNHKGLYLLGTSSNNPELQDYIQAKFPHNPVHLKLLIKEAVKYGFDYIIFDPPASFSLYTRTIISLCTNVIPVIELESFGFEALFTLIQELDEIKAGYEVSFNNNAAVINKYDKTMATHQHFFKKMTESPYDPLFVINYTKSLPFACAKSEVLQEYMPKNSINDVFAEMATYFYNQIQSNTP